jgi:cell division protein FtsB
MGKFFSWLAMALLGLVVLLQYRLWLSPDGVRELTRLSAAVERQKRENLELEERNQLLVAEVADLKSGLAAIEERARSELGMIGRNETFYQVVPVRPRTSLPSKPEPHTQTAAR